MHIFGLHAADLIHEASNAVATGQRVQDIKFNVHAHPTLSEVDSKSGLSPSSVAADIDGICHFAFALTSC